MRPILKCLGDFIKHGNSFLFLPTDFQALSFTSPQTSAKSYCLSFIVLLLSVTRSANEQNACISFLMQAFRSITRNKAMILLTQTELFDQGAIAVCILALEIHKQTLAAINHHDQAATGVVILGVGFEMAIQFVNAGGQ
jgi:hypothetical protein